MCVFAIKWSFSLRFSQQDSTLVCFTQNSTAVIVRGCQSWYQLFNPAGLLYPIAARWQANAVFMSVYKSDCLSLPSVRSCYRYAPLHLHFSALSSQIHQLHQLHHLIFRSASSTPPSPPGLDSTGGGGGGELSPCRVQAPKTKPWVFLHLTSLSWFKCSFCVWGLNLMESMGGDLKCQENGA